MSLFNLNFFDSAPARSINQSSTYAQDSSRVLSSARYRRARKLLVSPKSLHPEKKLRYTRRQSFLRTKHQGSDNLIKAFKYRALGRGTDSTEALVNIDSLLPE